MMWKHGYSSSGLFHRAKPFLAVIFTQFGQAGMAILAKSALNKGMNHFTFSVCRNVVSSLVFAPFALFLERKIRPKMTLSIFFKITLLGLLEPVIDQNLYYGGMKYTTASFTSAMCNIMPAVAFVMAWILRLEKVDIRRMHSRAKVVGTLASMSGAMIMTLVKGPMIGLPWTKEMTPFQSATIAASQQHPIRGALMIIAGCICGASFFVLQAITLRSFPAPLSLTSLMCTMGALQGAALTFIVERGNTAVWSLHWDIKLLSALYGGLVSSGVNYYLSGVVIKDKGPVFVTAFNPLSMVIVAILSTFILAETLHLGRVIGAIVIVTGLYVVIWGKSKDQYSSKMDGDDLVVAPIDQEMGMAKPCNCTEATNQGSANISKDTPKDETV